jgi:hypothetical protein
MIHRDEWPHRTDERFIIYLLHKKEEHVVFVTGQYLCDIELIDPRRQLSFNN